MYLCTSAYKYLVHCVGMYMYTIGHAIDLYSISCYYSLRTQTAA